MSAPAAVGTTPLPRESSPVAVGTPAPAPNQSSTNVFVAGLPPNTDDAKLRDLFNRYGEIVSAKVMVDLRTKMLRSHGFVMFADEPAAAAAVAAYAAGRPPADGGPLLHVSFATANDRDKTPAQPCESVYVRNLPQTVTPEALRTEFSKYGAVIDVTIPPWNASHQGVAFVRFATPADAARCVESAQSSTPFGRDYALQLRFKESRQMSFDRRQKQRMNASGDLGSSGGGSFAGSYGSTPAVTPPTSGTAYPGVMPSVPSAFMPAGHVVQPMVPYPGVPYAVGAPALPAVFGGAPVPGAMPGAVFGPPPGMMMVPAPAPPPFPAPGDLFFRGHPDQGWLKSVLAGWSPAMMLEHSGGTVVRLANPRDHIAAATALAQLATPAGGKLQPAIVK